MRVYFSATPANAENLGRHTLYCGERKEGLQIEEKRMETLLLRGIFSIVFGEGEKKRTSYIATAYHSK